MIESGVLLLRTGSTSALNPVLAGLEVAMRQWAVCVAMSSVVLWFGELRKFLLRRKDAMQQAGTIHGAEPGF